MRVREEIERLTRLWYWFAAAWALMLFLFYRGDVHGIIWASAVVGLGLPTMWVFGKLLLAASRRARAVFLATNVGFLAFAIYAVEGLTENFMRSSHLMQWEGFKFQFFLFALYVTLRTLAFLASQPARRYFAAD